MDKLIDIHDIFKIIDSLDDDRMNPITPDTSTCMYSDENSNHCIAGEILFRLGFELPLFDDVNNTTDIDTMICAMGYDPNFTEAAIEMLQTGQNTADIATSKGISDAWYFAKNDMVVFYQEELFDNGR